MTQSISHALGPLTIYPTATLKTDGLDLTAGELGKEEPTGREIGALLLVRGGRLR